MPNETLKTNYLSGPQAISLGTIQSGDRTIRVQSVAVFGTYRFSGIVSGVPSPEDNEETLEAISDFVKALGPTPTETFINVPQAVSMPIDQDAESEEADDDAENQPADRLPLFFVVAELESSATDPEYMFSSLRYVHFLEDIELGELPGILATEVTKIDWEEFAEDWTP